MSAFRCAATVAAILLLELPGRAVAVVSGPQVLYDGSLATSPAAQGWYSVVGSSYASETLSGSSVTLDTTLANITQAGYARAPLFSNAVTLDSSAGLLLSFTAGVATESHASDNRAGLSVIVLDSAHKGIELGFWTDRVFAQDLVSGSFVQAAAPERAALNTTGSTTYALQFSAAGYTLSANGSTLFSGPLRDYSSSGVSVLGVAVYAQPNFLFFGDDTSSARASWSLNNVSISPVPEPSRAAMLLTGLLVLGYFVRRRGNGRTAARSEVI